MHHLVTSSDTRLPAGNKAESAAAVKESVATTSTVSSPEAKTSRLLPEQEQVLLRFFGAQDRVDREEALLLARQVRLIFLPAHILCSREALQ